MLCLKLSSRRLVKVSTSLDGALFLFSPKAMAVRVLMCFMVSSAILVILSLMEAGVELLVTFGIYIFGDVALPLAPDYSLFFKCPLSSPKNL